MKILFAFSLLLFVQFYCQFVYAEGPLATIPKPTKVIIIKNKFGFSLELPELKGRCRYAFLSEGIRGILDCEGRFPSFSKTVPIQANPYIKQFRFGTHPDKLRIVIDLLTPAPVALVKEEKANFFSFNFGGLETKNSEIKPEVLKNSEVVAEKEATIKSKPVAPVVVGGFQSTNSKIKLEEPKNENVIAKKEATINSKPVAPLLVAGFQTTNSEIKLEELKNENVIAEKEATLKSEPVAPLPAELPISVENLQITFNEGERLIRDLIVTNNSSSQFSVSVDCYPEADLLQKKGDDVQTVSDNLNPSPRKFTLGPNQKRAVRFLLTFGKPNSVANKELLFVARFSNPDGDEIAPKVRFTYVPKESLPDLVSTPINGGLKLTNAGTAGVELSSGRCCRGGECESVNLSQLPAGGSVLLNVSEDCQLEFVRKYQGSFQKFKVRKEILNDASH